MTKYAWLTKEELIERLEKLEQFKKGPAAVENPIVMAALRDSEERLRGIVETAVEGIVTIDAKGTIASVNPAAEKMFGYRAEELIGRNVSLLMPSPYREQHDHYIARYLQSGKARIIGIGREVVGQRKDGSVFPMNLSVGEFRPASGRMFAGIMRDVSEQKWLEKQVLEIRDQEQQRIGQDLHDGLCQQLAGIELICQTLEEELLDEAPSLAGRAREIGRHVRNAITQTRSLSRGLSPVNLDTDSFHFALKELGTQVETLFRVECEVQTDQKIQIRDKSVATHLYRITQEAINNAIRHGKATKLTIRLEAPGSQAVLAICDNGCGMPPRAKKKRGMGLQIMRYRADIIEGELDIWSGKKGTEVRCKFPFPE